RVRSFFRSRFALLHSRILKLLKFSGGRGARHAVVQYFFTRRQDEPRLLAWEWFVVGLPVWFSFAALVTGYSLLIRLRWSLRPRHAISLLMVFWLCGSATPAAAQTIVGLSSEAQVVLAFKLDSLKHLRSVQTQQGPNSQNRGMPPTPVNPPGITPPPPLTKAEREAKVVRLETNVQGSLTLEVGRSVNLMAGPKD